MTRGDNAFPDLVQGNNQRWHDIAPDGKVYLPTSAADTARCVSALLRAGIRSGELSVRSGGHCYENHVFNSKIRAIIDVNLINTITYDPALDCIRVGAGCTLWDVYKNLQRQWGTTIPGGSCGTVGAGGHILGGGYGLLSRKYGVTVDYLHGVELVMADGSMIEITRDNPGPWTDLLWAHTGGGGGNFGIVTHFLLRDPNATKKNEPRLLLPAAPRDVIVVDTQIPWKQMGAKGERVADMLKNYNEWCKKHKARKKDSLDENLFCIFRIYPKRDTQGDTTAVRLTVQAAFLEGESRLTVEARWLEFFGHVLPTDLQGWSQSSSDPWLNATQAIARGAWDWRGEYKSAYHRDFDEQHIAAVLTRFRDHGTEPGAKGALVALDTYGGKVNEVSRTATADPHRDSILKLQYQSYWTLPEDDDAQVKWLSETYAKVYERTHGLPEATNSNPKKTTDGCFVNYLDAELPKTATGDKPSVWDLYYGKETFARLQAVKKLVDPHDLFHHNQSIPLPS